LSYYSDFKRTNNKISIIFCEAIVHGIIITISVLLILPQVRINGGKLLPAEAIDVSMFLLLLLVNNFRYFFNKNLSKLKLLIITSVNVSVIVIALVICALMHPGSMRLKSQFFVVLSTYDSLTMIINTTLFCLAVSLFI